MLYGKIYKVSAFLGEGALFIVDSSEILMGVGLAAKARKQLPSGSCEHFTQVISLKVSTIPRKGIMFYTEN